MVDVVADKVVLELDARTARYLGNVRTSRAAFDREMSAMGLSADRMERRVSASGQRMASALNQAIAGIAVAAVIKEAQVLADTWTQTGNKLAAAGVATESLGARQQQLLDVARLTRSEYSQTADIYARVTRSTQELNATDYQRLRVTELINKAVKAGGATTAEQISTITQLGQALASGNLQGDELRSIRENSPLIARAIAQEFGVTIGELKKLGAEGELTSDRVFAAILKYGSAIDQQFSRTRATIGESFTALKNEATEFLGTFDQALGVSTGIAEFTQKVADDFDLMAQAVIISAALVGGALVGRLTVPMQQAAVTNAKFVADLMAGRTALQLEAEAARANARQILSKAQADRDAARESVVATQQRINQLRQEAVAYQQNIALANQQRAAVAGIASGRNRGQFVSGADQASATTARDTATKALIANRLQLNRVTNELTVAEARLNAQHSALSGTLNRVATAHIAVRNAAAASTVVAQAATVAMRGLGVAMSFFGGPIGLAITAVAAALAYFSTEAAKAEAAGSNLRATLEETEQQAEETRDRVEDLSGSQRDGATASDTAATAARGSAGAYDAIAVSAANAAEYVKYLTAAQRQQRLEKLDEQIGDLRRAQDGRNIFTTNGRENVANLRANFIREAGLDERADRFDRTGIIAQRAATIATGPNATARQREAYQRYALAARTFNENNELIDRAVAERAVVLENANAPTLERPSPNTSNITPPTVNSGGGGGSTGGRRGRASREETREELEARREMAELERTAQLQREAGAETLAQFTEDEIARRRLIAELIDQQYDPADAETQANDFIRELRAARELADERETADQAREDAEEAAKEAEEQRIERMEQAAYLQEQDLLLQRELAALAGDSERVRELDKMIDRMQRIRELQEQGGLSPQAAEERARRDERALDEADIQGRGRAVFTDYARTFMDEIRNRGDAFAALGNKFADAAIDDLAQAVGGLLQQLFSGKGGGGNILSSIGSLFGKIPGFATGTMSAPSGLAYVHKDEVLMRPGQGTKILTAAQARGIGNVNARASRQEMSTNINFKQTIDLTGANGDATIRRIAYEAAAQGGAEAYKRASADIPAREQKKSQYRTRS